ncbi:lipoprotein LpqH [Mycolicibacterium vaccae]|uniref:lipoprotein LpqH n=1 Tax=Mycolicibacterium vaccae TaxID=1810 RepID=UPI003D05B379
MNSRQVLAVSAGVAALAVAGCSSPPPEYTPPPGALVPGTAQVIVDGSDAGTTESVQCDPAGSLMSIRTGSDESGLSVLVDGQDGLQVREVGIRDLGGFTGSYNDGLGGEASVTLTDRTYEISGTADGFQTDNPSFRSSSTFHIKIAC